MDAIFKPAEGNQAPRSKSAAESPQASSALVERARVVDVNIRDFTVDTSTEHTYKKHFDIPFSTPYCHYENGEGINFMPEIGSVCYVCKPSEEEGTEFVIGWVMPDDDKGKYRGGRPLLNPGDLHFSTRDGNFVIIRRGGVVQIGATDICQTVYIPIRNIIETFAENLGVHTPAGDLTWEVARKDEDANGHQKTLLTLEAHEYSDDPIKDPVFRLKIGSHGDGNQTLVTLETRDKGGGAVKQSLLIAKTGDIAWKLQKFTLDAQGDVLLKTAAKLDARATQDMTLQSDAKFSAKGSQATLEGGGAKLDLSSGGAKIDGASLTLPGGTFPVLRDSPDYQAWVAKVTAALAVAGPVSGFAGLTAPVQYSNSKIKV